MPAPEASQTLVGQAATAARPAAASGYIVNPWYDSVFFIFAPALGIVLMLIYACIPHALEARPIAGQMQDPATFAIGVFTMSHLVIVFFRSHANPRIFQRYPLRFTLVPILMVVAMCGSLWVTVIFAILGVWWDVYHSSLQTFGLGRIYDQKMKNDARVGRRLDYFLNLVLYLGPIFAGASFMAHTNSFLKASNEQLPAAVRALAHLSTWTTQNARAIQLWVIPAGCAYVAYYLYSYRKLALGGYRVSPQKVALLASTATCSVLVWGMNPAGTAFIIMNFFHALQYFGLVWIIEGGNMQRVFGLGDARKWKPLVLALFLVIAIGYGTWAYLVPNSLSQFGDWSPGRLAIAATLMVSICHFWWDGFIWSVRDKQV
jgi:hypothetical protein